MDVEIWKDIPGYEGRYQASNLGRIKSVKSQTIMSNKRSDNDYIIVNLCKDGKKRSFTAHRLIAKTFLPNPDNLPCVNHKNENKQDNRVDNLEWCSQSYNSTYGSRPRKQAEKLGKRVICVETGEVYKSFGLAGKAVGRPYQDISRACKVPSRTCAGFHWTITEDA